MGRTDVGRSLGWGVALGGALGTTLTLLFSVAARYLLGTDEIILPGGAPEASFPSTDLGRYVLVTAIASGVVLVGCLVALWVLRPRALRGSAIALVVVGVLVGFAALPWLVNTAAALAIGDVTA
ncbi:MAG: hypothetical protein PGN15_00945 [Aeromicrobium erythreum]